ncbi:MAG TPA: hypothetical protein PKE47_11575, partial [Verrucomicrobiota bacterium]|nr:hypothetical protein [Verrucomicrobiota bacterium]
MPASALDYLLRFAWHNLLFGGGIRLEGVLASEGPSMVIGQAPGGASLVISQPWAEAADPEHPHPDEGALEQLLRGMGFEPLPGGFFAWRHPRHGIVIWDARPDNFIATGGEILPIDLQIGFKDDNALASPSACVATSTAADVVWRCPNPDCPAQVRGRLTHWCSRGAMDIEGGGEVLGAQLVKAGLALDVAEAKTRGTDVVLV